MLPNGSRIDYVLDALGRRIGKVVGGALVRGWLYGGDSLRPMAQLDASGQIEATFVYATHVNVPDAIVLRSGTVYRVLTDHLGSVRLVVDAANGGVVQRLDYDEFGNVLSDTNPGFQPFGFAGGLYDVDTKLVRFGVRDYDAVTGRWTARDPTLFAGGDTNLYAYCGNDPVNWVDPTGLDAMEDFADWLDDSGVDDFAAGFGDSLTGIPFTDLSLTGALRDAAGWNGSVDMCSSAYGAGSTTGTVGQFAFGAAGLARGAGYSVTMGAYKHGGGGLNVLKKGERVFGADWHKFKLDGKMVNRPHAHWGDTAGQMSRHRPWQQPGGGGWRLPWD